MAPDLAPPSPGPEAPSAEEPALFTEDELVPAAEVGRGAGPARPRLEARGEAVHLDDLELSESEDSNGDGLIQDRLLGGLADLVIHLAVLGTVVLAVHGMGVPLTLEDWPAFAGFGLVFSFLYSVIPLAFWGKTPGMAWVGHSARSLGDESLTFGQTALRWTGAILTVGLAGLPLLLALGGGRSLSDRLSDSKTVQS